MHIYVMFLHMSVILFTGGVSRPTPRGRLRGLAGSPGPHLGGSPGPHLGESPGPHPGGSPGPHLEGLGYPQHALRQTPPPKRQLLLWVVRILLECILVYFKILSLENEKLKKEKWQYSQNFDLNLTCDIPGIPT